MNETQESKMQVDTFVIATRQIADASWEAVLLQNGRIERVYKGSTVAEVVAHATQVLFKSDYLVDTRMTISVTLEQPNNA